MFCWYIPYIQLRAWQLKNTQYAKFCNDKARILLRHSQTSTFVKLLKYRKHQDYFLAILHFLGNRKEHSCEKLMFSCLLKYYFFLMTRHKDLRPHVLLCGLKHFTNFFGSQFPNRKCSRDRIYYQYWTRYSTWIISTFFQFCKHFWN